MKKSMQKFTMIDNIPIRYDIQGSGERNFLIIHGFIESIEIFEEFSEQLSKLGKVLILDLPGNGMSGYDGRDCLSMDYMADIVYALLEKIQIGKVTVIGHSMGGYIALSLAEKHEEILNKIVLLHSTPYAATESRRKEREQDLNTILNGKKDTLIKINSEGRFAPENTKKCQDNILDMAEAVEMSDNLSVAATLRGLISRGSHEEYFKNCKLPKLMIFGEKDSYISLERAKEVSAAFPDCNILWLEHSGHMGFLEEPEIIINNI